MNGRGNSTCRGPEAWICQECVKGTEPKRTSDEAWLGPDHAGGTGILAQEWQEAIGGCELGWAIWFSSWRRIHIGKENWETSQEAIYSPGKRECRLDRHGTGSGEFGIQGVFEGIADDTSGGLNVRWEWEWVVVDDAKAFFKIAVLLRYDPHTIEMYKSMVFKIYSQSCVNCHHSQF